MYRLIAKNASDDQIKEVLSHFASFSEDSDVQKVYKLCMRSEISSEKMQHDLEVGTGNYWPRLYTASQDVRIHEFQFLAEMFMDMEIELIVNACWKCEQNRNLWSPEQRVFAYGS